jgi:NAD(P)-dependent dehydrogenase (short-subunit alcohol dehydrogenase family)
MPQAKHNTHGDRVAIVTGASRGLGLALARRLAADGWRLVIDARGREDLEQAARELAQLGDVRALAGDVSDAGHRTALLDAAGGRIDLLVNNASVLGPSPQPELHAYPLAVLEAVLRVNLLAPLALIQLALPRMRDGVIINVTSDAAVQPYAGWGGYGSSKAALEQLTAILGAEHPQLRVYAVDPGDMRTRMHQEAFPGQDISDRPPPEDSVPGLLSLIEQAPPSGRYIARDLADLADVGEVAV